MHRKEHSTIRRFERDTRVRELLDAGIIQTAADIPPDAIPATVAVVAKWRSRQSLVARPPYYRDIEFACQDCGKAAVWRAQDQRHWYEVLGGSMYAEPRRCADCRRKRKG